MNGSVNNMKSSIIILCLLGDPVLPAASCDRTGGFNVDMEEILKYWSNFSYSITVITNGSSYVPYEYEQLYKNVEIYRVPLEDSIMNQQPQLEKEFPRVLQATIDIIDKANINPLFFHSYYWYSGLLALRLSQKYKVKFLHSVIALSIDKKLSNSPNFCSTQLNFEKTFFPYASYIMAISNTEKKTLMEHYKCIEENIIVVGRSVHDAFLLPDHNNQGISHLLIQNNEQKWKIYLKEQTIDSWWYQGAFTYIGRIKYEKGVGNIIEAWYQLYLSNMENMPPLWIVGGQPDTISPLRNDFINRYPDFLSLEKQMKICWWGYLTPASINAVLLKSSVVVTHSQYEAGGRVIIEALSAGKPIIATPTGFAADLVKDWQNGFLVPFGNISLLKKRMEHFIRHPLIALPLGEYARYTFQKATDNWHYYEKHKIVYDYLCNHYQEKPIFFDEKVNIFDEIPDFYSKKLLYSWPAPKEIEKKICAYLKKKWYVGTINLEYCPDLSHHSFIWKLYIKEKEYYIKYLYTSLNDIALWNDGISPCKLHKATHAYEIAINSLATIEIKEKNQQLTFYITEQGEILQYSEFIKDYKDILKKIYVIDTSIDTFNELSFDLDVYTYAQLAESVYNEIGNFTELYQDFQNVLNKEISYQNIAVSYGKEFFSHILYTTDGYQLLPSSSVCLAPLGIDAAIFLVEISKELGNNLTPKNFYKLLVDASEIFGISSSVLFCLCLLTKLLSIKREHKLRSSFNEHVDWNFWKELLVLIYPFNSPKANMENDNDLYLSI